MKREKKIHKKILTYQNTYTVHFDIINSFYAIFIGIYLPSLPLPSFAIEIRLAGTSRVGREVGEPRIYPFARPVAKLFNFYP